MGLKWVCDGSNPQRCQLPQTTFQCLQFFRGFILKIIKIKPFPSSELPSQPLHASHNPLGAQSIARLPGGTRQRPPPDSERGGNGAGLDLKLLPGGAAFQKSILILSLKLASSQAVHFIYLFILPKPTHFWFKTRVLFHLQGRDVINPVLVNPADSAALPRIRHPSQDLAVERSPGSFLLP